MKNILKTVLIAAGLFVAETSFGQAPVVPKPEMNKTARKARPASEAPAKSTGETPKTEAVAPAKKATMKPKSIEKTN